MQLWLTWNYGDEAGFGSQKFACLPSTGMKCIGHHVWLAPKFLKLEETLPKGAEKFPLKKRTRSNMLCCFETQPSLGSPD